MTVTDEYGCATAAISSDDMLAAGISYRQLDYWCSKGYLRPDSASPGSGYARRFPPEEREIARLMVVLTKAGLEPKAAARAAREGVENDQPYGTLNDSVAVFWTAADLDCIGEIS
jgi:DNA-binding transcriptional MerR regulator